MVSQLLFGEFVTIGEEKDDFAAVTCNYDGYTGWVQRSQLTPVDEGQLKDTNEYTGEMISRVTLDDQRRMVPFGAPVYLTANEGVQLRFGNKQVDYTGLQSRTINAGKDKFNEEGLHNILPFFHGVPYLWGGKSVFGIDCSGFVQQVFKLFAIRLLRDAYLQAEQGRAVNSLAEAKWGDLVFFQNEKGRVMHVGILLNQNEIVHASGCVRIDRLDNEGIVHKETGAHTHRFHSIRRFS
jgi:cell wall-associated NlpC family hydrolase